MKDMLPAYIHSDFAVPIRENWLADPFTDVECEYFDSP